MKLLRVLLFAILAMAAAVPAFSQGRQASLIDLNTGATLWEFLAGNDVQSIAWTGGRYAWAGTDGGGLARIDLTRKPPAMDRFYPYEGPIFISGNRAIVSDALLDLSTDPPTVVTALPEHGGVAFFAGGNRAVMVFDFDIILIDGVQTNAPSVNTFFERLSSYGHSVAVNPAGTMAVITLDDVGGVEVVDITDISAPQYGGVVPPLTSNEDPLGIAATPDGRFAIFVNESVPIPEAVVVDISIRMEPYIVATIPLELYEPSAIQTNPATGDVIIAGDDGLAIIKAPYTSVDRYIWFPNGYGTTARALAINDAGTRAIALQEDSPELFEVDPLSLTFPLQATGSVSAPQIVRVTNRDVTPRLQIRSITATGPFIVTSLCPAELAADPIYYLSPKAAAKALATTCEVEVRFAPTVGGNGQTGWLSVSTNVGAWVVALTGDAQEDVRSSRIAVDPPSLAFGEVMSGQTATRTFRIYSNGLAPLNLTGMSMTGPFQFLSECGAVLAPGQSCLVIVTFTPTAIGPASGALVVEHDAPGSPTTVAISAIGAPPPAPRIQLSLTRVEFDRQGLGTGSTPRRLVVKNVGSAPLHVVRISSDSPEFTVTSQCGAPVDIGQECVATIVFDPRIPGPRNGTLTVDSDAGDFPHLVVPMAGTGCRAFRPTDARNIRPVCLL